eukprot:TRINITY_DN13279_c0_g1_i1.p1 TRINITY_DN13279_c0_g1~~TRINITY_DN13279_c0_g1_i1.p1  ORF type:complete len:177 (-),score=29.61 TRINITY_DN13279_c0_g1_i1:36-566(-)
MSSCNSPVWGTLLFALLTPIAAATYGRPPCSSGETYVTFGNRVFCAPACDGKGQCAKEKPNGAFGDPACALIDMRKDFQKSYCGLTCTANSYCPDGMKCSKPKVGDGDPANPFRDQLPDLMPQDSIQGLCTYKRDKQVEKESKLEKPVKTMISNRHAKSIMEKFGIMPPPQMRDDL